MTANHPTPVLAGMSADDREAHRRAFRMFVESNCELNYVGLFRFYRARVGTERAAGVDPTDPKGEDRLPVFVRARGPGRVTRRPSWWALLVVAVASSVVYLVAIN